MTTAIIVTDRLGRYQFKPTGTMIDSNTNHCSLFYGITENSCLVTDRATWAAAHIAYPPAESCEIYIGPTVADVKSFRPLRPIIVAGNQITLDNIKEVDTLIVVRYEETLADDMLISKKRFPFPKGTPKVLFAPSYRILQYEIKCPTNFENQSELSETLAVASSANSLYRALTTTYA